MKKLLIKDSRLHKGLERLRSGKHQVFNKTTGRNTNDEFILTPPKLSWYAELIDDQWWWVEGCSQCLGEDRSVYSYVECDKHNVCSECSIKRDEVKSYVWGIIGGGWKCPSCYTIKYEEVKAKALLEVSEADHPDCHFEGNDSILCPYCAYETEGDQEYNDGAMECERCDNEFRLAINYTTTYSTYKFK